MKVIDARVSSQTALESVLNVIIIDDRFAALMLAALHYGTVRRRQISSVFKRAQSFVH